MPRPLHSITRLTTSFITSLALALAPVAMWSTPTHAAEQIDRSMARSVGKITEHSVLKIPDLYLTPKTGNSELDFTLSLQKWMNEAEFINPLGETDLGAKGANREYLLPVEIKSAAAGSAYTENLKDGLYYVPLKDLGRKDGELVIMNDTELKTVKRIVLFDGRNANASTSPSGNGETAIAAAAAASAPAKPAELKPAEFRLLNSPFKKINIQQDQKLEAQLPICPNGQCSEGQLAKLVSDLQSPLIEASLATVKKSKNAHQTIQAYKERFAKDCGFSFDIFEAAVKKKSIQTGMPIDLIMSFLTNETIGQCYPTPAFEGKDKQGRDRWGAGLGQITVYESQLCSASQKTQLRRMSKNITSLDELRDGPECAENPASNLDKMFSLAKGMYDDITNKKNGGFDADTFKQKGRTLDLWRLMASAYNGGQRWVLEAKRDLEAFNAKNNTKLDPYNWEDLRVFYVLKYLDRSEIEKLNGRGSVDRRSVSNAIKNIGYAEAIIPRHVDKLTLGMNEMWLREMGIKK